MATAGHFVTMTGVLAFYIMFLDSHREKKISLPLNYMVPRLNKRILYYVHKIIYLFYVTKKSKNMPSKLIRLFLINSASILNEFEVYSIVTN